MRPPNTPFQIALPTTCGVGSSTGSMTRVVTARYQIARNSTTPISGTRKLKRDSPLTGAPRAGRSREQCALIRTNSGSASVASVRGRAAIDRDDVGDLRRRAGKQQHLVGEIDRFLEIVRDDQRGGADLLEHVLQLLAHEQRHLVVERRERLVEEQHLRLDHQRAQDRDQLLLAAGHLVGIEVEIDADAEAGDELFHPAFLLAPGDLHEFERVGDVVAGAQPGKQRLPIVLEHVADAYFADLQAVEQDFAAVARQTARPSG